jgi:predicted ArsR family transcriptional regulator
MKEGVSARQFGELLAGGGDFLANRFQAIVAGKGLRARVLAAVRLLNSIGGAAQSEKSRDGFTIRSRACPLAAVVVEHPETCQMVERFLGQLIGLPVQEQCIRNGRASCRFAVGGKAGS